MSTSSDSEDENLKQILEAADTSLLKNSLFQTNIVSTRTEPSKETIKSQRHINLDNYSGTDFVPSETVQKLMSKKLTALINETVEFTTFSNACELRNKKRKSRVRLLRDFDCYVKPFEDFEYEDTGLRKKPYIKRRNVDGDDELDEGTKIKSVAIDGDFILSQKETENWSNRSKPKLFQYKLGKGITKVHNYIEPTNEFTKLRRKNQWNESKIRKTKFPTK